MLLLKITACRITRFKHHQGSGGEVMVQVLGIKGNLYVEQWPDWSSVFGRRGCQYQVSTCHAGCGSCCRPGHSAGCKETIGSRSHRDQLDSRPDESQGVAHLLPGNTLVSAPWRRTHSSNRTSIPVLWINLSGVSMSHWLVLSCKVQTKCEETREKKPKHYFTYNNRLHLTCFICMKSKHVSDFRRQACSFMPPLIVSNRFRSWSS